MEEKRKYRLLTNGGYSVVNVGGVFDEVRSHNGGVDLKVTDENGVTYSDGLHFYWREVELVEDKPHRYKSIEVHGMDVIALSEHWQLNFQEGNILKYLLRDKGEDESDMQKIADYANRELELIKQRKNK